MERNDKSITWHTATLPKPTLRALEYLSVADWLRATPLYLAGGTALALQVGHRRSVDLDFFSPEKDFAPASVLKHLSEPEWKTDDLREGTLYGTLLGASVSFIAYPFFIPKEPFLEYGNVCVLSVKDIAVMKIVAISQRGRKRDFLDLYWYSLHSEPLIDVMRRLPEQYPTVAHNYHHILKSLVYFEDAEEDPEPRLNFDTDWKRVKEFFRTEVTRAAKELLGIAP